MHFRSTHSWIKIVILTISLIGRCTCTSDCHYKLLRSLYNKAYTRRHANMSTSQELMEPMCSSFGGCDHLMLTLSMCVVYSLANKWTYGRVQLKRMRSREWEWVVVEILWIALLDKSPHPLMGHSKGHFRSRFISFRIGQINHFSSSSSRALLLMMVAHTGYPPATMVPVCHIEL